MISKFYGFLASLRRLLYEKDIIQKKKLPKPVISIGNLSVGGTGKTPLTIAISKYLQSKGYRVCVLSRGYKRKSKGEIIVSNGEKIFVDIKISGDEPYLIAKNNIPVVVGKSRYKAGIKALKNLDIDIFILDDGFQHFQLFRDLNILIVDGQNPFWEDKLLPVGRLREPIDFYKFADIFVITKYEKKKENIIKTLEIFNKPFFFIKEISSNIHNFKEIYPLDYLSGKKVFVFSGIGNNQYFFQKLYNLSKKFNFSITGFKQFPDHFDYENIDLKSIFPEGNLYITTEKDFVKIKNLDNVFALEYKYELEDNMKKYIDKFLLERG